MTKARQLVVGYASLRIAYALGLLAAPGRTARPWLGDAAGEAGGSIAVRGLGARDLVLSVGAIAAAVAPNGSPRPWLAACAASDAVDLAATLIADGELPSKSKPGTAVAAGAFGAAGAALALRGP